MTDTAAKLSAPLDATMGKVVRSILESRATLSTELRSGNHELAGLVASLLLPQLAVIVGPDISTLAHQKEKVERTGATTVLLEDAKGEGPAAHVLDAISSGAVKVVFATPEILSRTQVLRAFARVGLGVMMILEAHRAATSSHAFSGAYARLGDYLARLGKPPVFALAPGATSVVCHDISIALFPHPPDVFGGPGVRSNVSLAFKDSR